MTSIPDPEAMDAGNGHQCRVLLVHRYYWPDTPPYAQMLHQIAIELQRAGFLVTVLTGNVPYQSAVDARTGPPFSQQCGIEIRRLRLLRGEKSSVFRRAWNVVAFTMGMVLHVITNRRFDVIMVGTVPPVIAAATGSLLARMTGARFVYHCQDIHPEAAIAAGMLRSRRIGRLLQKIDTATCRRAARVVVLSNDMRDTLAQRGQDTSRVVVRNNFLTAAPADSASGKLPMIKEPGEFWCLFAGNLGRFQGLEVLIDAAKLLRDEPQLRILFAGDGAMRADLEARAAGLTGTSVCFLGLLPQAAVDELVRRADVAIVALTDAMHRYAYPSKTMTYLSGGARLLVIAEPGSDLVRDLVTAGLAVSCPPGSAAEVAAALRSARSSSFDVDVMREAAMAYAHQQFSAEVVLPHWVQIFRSALDARSR